MSVLVAYRVRWWREILSLCLAAWALLIPIGYASATTTTSTFQSQVTIVASCTILNAANLDFGSNGILTANVDQTNSIQVQCTSSTPYDIGLDAGTASGATVTTRKMTNGANTVSYSLYSDSGRTTN